VTRVGWGTTNAVRSAPTERVSQCVLQNECNILFFLLWSHFVWHELWCDISVKFISNVFIVNRSSLEMPDAGQRAIKTIPT
jgi:hypothetical protein